MAATNRKILLQLCIEGARGTKSAKTKLAFIRLAVELMGKKESPETELKISSDMQKLLNG